MNQIRFLAFDGDTQVAQTEWTAEAVSTDAPNLLAGFRQQHDGTYAYQIERRGDNKAPNKVPLYRYRIKVGDATYYSRICQEKEKAQLAAEVHLQFPGAEITEEQG